MITTKALIEGVIFASAHPVSGKLLAEVLELPLEEVQSALAELQIDYEVEAHGFSLVQIASGYQFRTKSELKDIMAKFYEKKPPRLTQATMEVLSVVAYKQPITRPQIEKIRGVDCTAVLKTLLDRDLIEMRGRSDLPGHPVVYGTTEKFLEWFQINDLQDLPPLSEMEILNHGLEEGTENLLGLLNRDDGFTAESLSEMDATLLQAGRQNVIDPSEEAAKAAENEETEVGITEAELLSGSHAPASL